MTSEKESSLAEINYGYDAAGNLAEKQQKEKTSKYTYDKTGRLLSETTAKGSTTSYEYDKNGNIISVIDPLKRKTGYRYDAEGNLIEEIDAKGNSAKSAYDEEGNQTAEENRMRHMLLDIKPGKRKKRHLPVQQAGSADRQDRRRRSADEI